MKTQSTDFNEHLKRIKTAKNTASILEQMTMAEKSMGILWEQIFDILCINPQTNDFTILKEMTSILSKLLNNYRQLFAISKKINDQTNNDNAWAISESVLKEIEEQLQLL